LATEHRSAVAAPGQALDIVALVGDFPALSKTFVVDQLIGLRRAGHRVRLIADPPIGDGASELHSELDGMLYYRNAPDRPLPGTLLRFVGAVRRALQCSVGGTVAVLRMTDLPRYRRLQLLELLVAVAELGDADVYHCHFGPLGVELARVREALGFRGSLVTAFHGYDISSYLRRFGDGAFDHLLETGELFLPISDHWSRRLVELGAPAQRVRVHHMGVDSALFRVSPPRVYDGILRVLSIGRLVEKKGFDDGLRAVARLQERGGEVVYTIVGEGPERERLETLVAELGLHDVVEITGALPRERVRTLLQAQDLLLCPSVTASSGDSEGIPVVLMEAMASSVPVVATEHSGIPELVRDGWSGLLAPEHDYEALADHLKRLADDRELALRLAVNGRRAIEQSFDVRRLVADLEAQLVELVARERTGGG